MRFATLVIALTIAKRAKRPSPSGGRLHEDAKPRREQPFIRNIARNATGRISRAKPGLH